MVTKAPASNASVLAEWLTDERRASIPPGLVRLAESLSDAVDRDTSESCPMCKRSGANAALWREYRIALGEMTAALGGDDDGEDSVLAAMRSALVDAKKPGAKKSGAGAGGSGRKPRPAADAVATTGRGRRPRAS